MRKESQRDSEILMTDILSARGNEDASPVMYCVRDELLEEAVQKLLQLQLDFDLTST